MTKQQRQKNLFTKHYLSGAVLIHIYRTRSIIIPILERGNWGTFLLSKFPSIEQWQHESQDLSLDSLAPETKQPHSVRSSKMPFHGIAHINHVQPLLFQALDIMGSIQGLSESPNFILGSNSLTNGVICNSIRHSYSFFF